MERKRFTLTWLKYVLSASTILLFAGLPTVVSAAEGRQIEEVVVTAERRESTVSDTSISITAFTGEMIEDFGIRNQTDLQNMIPATTIQPYDSSVRGVGRNFRNLGGDPGVATYMNNVYSEDLYTAVIGSLWDIQRIEVLRGPQGTLYGRNAVGGAMNFLYKEPTDEFEARIKGIVGTFDTADVYGAVSGPLIDGVLAGRATYSKRSHDGFVEEDGRGPDLDSGDEENIAVQLRWTPTDNVSVKVRSNKAFVDRVMGGANGGGLVVLRGESFDGRERDFTNYVFGYRQVDAAQTNPLAKDFLDPSQQVFTFTNPATNAPVQAQNIRAGVDPIDADGRPNQGFGLPNSTTQCVFEDTSNIDGDDVCATTNGLNFEVFSQQGNQFETEWDVNDRLTLKYIFGLNELLYERITDDDSVASQLRDRQFYVNHEAEYKSHEIQAFYEVGESFSFTSGIFFYDSRIDQRGDFYSSARESQYLDDAVDLGLAAAIGFGPKVGIFSARTLAQANGAAEGTLTAATGVWTGDAGDAILHGPATPATDLIYNTTTEREAFAAYTQGVWDINEEFTLTVGVRYAYDDIDGEENLFRYTELFNEGLLGNDATTSPIGQSLASYNIARGALDPTTLQPTGTVPVYTTGIPFSLSVFRDLQRKDEKLTWRVNLDYSPNDSSLWYFGVTTGYRSGGFNLVFFSQTAQYDPEELIAYEIGYKGNHLDNTLQVNGSVYYYDYDTIHTFGTEVSLAGGTSTSVLEAPGAVIFGAEVEILWLATDHLTLGGNFSFTPSEYNESLLLADGADPRFPSSLFDPLDRRIDIDGNQLLQVPEYKGTVWASYGFPVGEGRLEFLGLYSFIDDVYYSAFETEFDKAPGYERLDLRATWTSAEGNWAVAAFANNVFDELGVRQLLRHGEEDGFRRTAQLTEPRMFGLEVSYKLGAY